MSKNPPERPSALEHPSIRLGLVSALRRDLIAHLADEHDKIHPINELAERLCPDDERDLITAFEIQLHHVHLPALDEVDLVEYDPDAKHVDPAAPSELNAVAAYLQSNAE